MPYSEALAERVRRVIGQRRDMEEKRLFGGLGIMLRGNLCVAVWGTSLIVRLDPAEAEEAVTQPHVTPFDVTGRPMKGWVVVSADGLDTEAELTAWVERAMEFVRGLPAK